MVCLSLPPTIAEKGPEWAQEGQDGCPPKNRDEGCRQMVALSKNVRADTTLQTTWPRPISTYPTQVHRIPAV